MTLTFQKLQQNASELAFRRDRSLADYLALARETPMAGTLPSYVRPLAAAFLSNFTIQGLSEACHVAALPHNVYLKTYHAPYNQVQQETLNEKSGLYQFSPDIIFVIMDAPAAFGPRDTDDIRSAIARFTNAHVVFFNFPKGENKNILNSHLNTAAKNDPTFHVFDFEKFLEEIGEHAYWRTKYAALGDFRLAPAAFPLLADHLMPYVIAASGTAKKCVVLDLDNTVWKGVVGEDGVEGVTPETNFQRHIATLYDQGIILAVNSKNNIEDAMEVFEKRDDMILKKNDFAAWRINWKEKAENMAELAEELNIGIDSFVFVDDDPFQRGIVKKVYPEITVLAPDDLPRYAGFSSFVTTEEDRRRGALYAEERKRKEFEQTHKDAAAFLHELELRVSIQGGTAETIPRISQLTQKTNQFNLTTRRYSEKDIRDRLQNGWQVWTAEAKDRFGDYGIVGLTMVEPLEDTWRIDTFLMSCRALGKGIEHALLAHVIREARTAGARTVSGEYIPTPKNMPCQTFLPDAEFIRSEEHAERHVYIRDAEKPFAPPPFITLT